MRNLARVHQTRAARADDVAGALPGRGSQGLRLDIENLVHRAGDAWRIALLARWLCSGLAADLALPAIAVGCRFGLPGRWSTRCPDEDTNLWAELFFAWIAECLACLCALLVVVAGVVAERLRFLKPPAAA
ncbi:MAG: hypothetical protein ACK5RP_09430 [Betaproteobacteria bacterium]